MLKIIGLLLISLNVNAGFLDWFNSDETKFKIVNHSNIASPGTVFARAYENALTTTGARSEFYQARSCNDAKKVFNNNKDAVMIYNTNVGISAINKGLDCTPEDLSTKNGLFFGTTYYQICTRSDSGIQLKNAKTLGAASVVLSEGIINDYNRMNGMNIKGIPYGGSKGVLKAVLAGDIEYGQIGWGIAEPKRLDGSLKCDYSTDPNTNNFVGNDFKLRIPNLKLNYLVYTNSDSIDDISTLKSAIGTDGFTKYVKHKFIRNASSEFTDSSVKDFHHWYNFNYDTYWK